MSDERPPFERRRVIAAAVVERRQVLSRIPIRNPAFTGREDLLAQLRKNLTKKNAVHLPQALNGLGGVGRTQLVFDNDYDRRDYRGSPQRSLMAHRFVGDLETVICGYPQARRQSASSVCAGEENQEGTHPGAHCGVVRSIDVRLVEAFKRVGAYSADICRLMRSLRSRHQIWCQAGLVTADGDSRCKSTVSSIRSDLGRCQRECFPNACRRKARCCSCVHPRWCTAIRPKWHGVGNCARDAPSRDSSPRSFSRRRPVYTGSSADSHGEPYEGQVAAGGSLEGAVAAARAEYIARPWERSGRHWESSRQKEIEATQLKSASSPRGPPNCSRTAGCAEIPLSGTSWLIAQPPYYDRSITKPRAEMRQSCRLRAAPCLSRAADSAARSFGRQRTELDGGELPSVTRLDPDLADSGPKFVARPARWPRCAERRGRSQSGRSVDVGHLQGLAASVAVAADPLGFVQQVGLFADRHEVIGSSFSSLAGVAFPLGVAERGHRLQKLIHAVHFVNRRETEHRLSIPAGEEQRSNSRAAERAERTLYCRWEVTVPPGRQVGQRAFGGPSGALRVSARSLSPTRIRPDR